MMDLHDFKAAVVIMAHPDDEILWASSILASAKKIILCYNQAPNSREISSGRRTLFDDFPLKTVVNLDITESSSYQTTNWRRPVETPYGLQCGRNVAAYERNFHLLTEALQQHIGENDVVVTHNPWGEYGHEEHVQVFRAVSKVQETRPFRLFVTNYVSDRVLYFMEKNTYRLGAPSAPLATDKALAEKLKRHYQAHNCWTWEDTYEWPSHECFYEVAAPGAPLRRNERTMASGPVNVVWLDAHSLIWSRDLRAWKRRLITAVLQFLGPRRSA